MNHPHWGARKLLAWLEQREPWLGLPAASTVGQILRRHGLIKPGSRKRQAVGGVHYELAEPYAPNVVWSTDYKGQFRTGDGRYCYPLTMTDNCARYLLACRGMLGPTVVGSRPWFERAFCEFGLPLVIRSDNGTPFASSGLAGLSQLSAWWIKLGIRPELIMPGQPQQNGRHERMHRTLKQETTRPPGADLRDQQRRFDAFVREYNEESPHEALQQRTPASVYVASPRAYPRRLPPVEYSGGHEVRHVRSNGEIKFLGQLLYVSEVLVGEPIGLLRIDEQLWRIDFSFTPIGVLDTSTMRIATIKSSSKKRGALRPPPPSNLKIQGKTNDKPPLNCHPSARSDLLPISPAVQVRERGSIFPRRPRLAHAAAAPLRGRSRIGRIGRTSTQPMRAGGIFAASRIASFRSRASIR
jgi:putative transposase